MKSPFPGMDPYIEGCGLFEDFHFDLIAEIKQFLARELPDRYEVRTGERGYVVLTEAEGRKEHAFLPDIGIASPTKSAGADATSITAVIETASDGEAVELRAFISTEFRENFIEIYDAKPDRALVTCIEVLSPSNKRRGSPGWELFLRKRQGLLMGAANFVEIDLLRAGDKMPMLDPWPSSPYTLLVARKLFAPNCRVWPAHFRRSLPVTPIPLLHPDPDVKLNLQSMLETIYERFHYGRSIDYTRPLAPPLSDDDSKWLAEQLQRSGKSA